MFDFNVTLRDEVQEAKQGPPCERCKDWDEQHSLWLDEQARLCAMIDAAERQRDEYKTDAALVAAENERLRQELRGLLGSCDTGERNLDGSQRGVRTPDKYACDAAIALAAIERHQKGEQE